jgi:hypothetical protein
LNFSEQQIEAMSPNPAAFVAGKKLAARENWLEVASSPRAIWGSIKGSGKSPYLTQVDSSNVAYKCTCPSRQFPCKHSIALLVLYTNRPAEFKTADEPEWVTDWMDKRTAKEEKKSEPPKELTEEDIVQREKNKENTVAARLGSILAGAIELELWLKDLVRMGLLNLPNKDRAEFQKVAARMVDAKAPGLAGWIKSMGDIDYRQPEVWQAEALAIIAKVHLLVRALKNYEQLSPLWQQTIRTLAGFSQSAKELVENEEAETIKDDWLVAGQEVTTNEEEITIQRNWLIGIQSKRTALILNFGTKFTTLDNSVVPGSILEAELAFFPSVLAERAVVKRQRRVVTTLPSEPATVDTITQVHEHKIERLKINPWSNDHVVVLGQARLINNGKQWLVADHQKNALPVVNDWAPQKPIGWLSISGNKQLPMTMIIRGSSVLPLGVVKEGKYHLL